MVTLRRMDRSVSRLQALLVSLGLSALFLLVYGGCQWITAQRTDVGVFYFSWERALPFVPALILPYLSIDLFFVAAPFLFHDPITLRAYAKRVAAVILVAGAFFLVLPLHYAFPRPPVGGWQGALFDGFRALDAPTNLFPSLHAALLWLLVGVYARQLRGFVRVIILAWFVLIALSPVLTRQHHVADIVGGVVLAAATCYFIRAKAPDP